MNDSLPRTFFPRRECQCTRCSGARAFQSFPTPSDSLDTTPCFISQDSTVPPAIDEFNSQLGRPGAYGSPCFTISPATQAQCLTLGHALSNAPARGDGTYGDGSALSRAMFVLGDSHALHMVAGLASALQGSNMSVAFATTMHGAGFNADWPWDLTWPESACAARPRWRCRAWKLKHEEYNGPAYVATARAALEQQLRPGDVVTIVNDEAKLPTLSFLEAQVAFLRNVSAAVGSKGAKVLLIADTPRLWKPGRECLHADSFHLCATPVEYATSCACKGLNLRRHIA